MSSLVCIEKKLCDIEALLSGDLTVQPGDQWAALLESAVSAALENTEITIGNQPLSVTIDTSDGPIEVTGELAVTQSGDWTVSVDNFPTSISIDNFEDIGTVSVNLESQDNPIEVELTGPQQQLLVNIADAINGTIRADWEPTGMCVFSADGTLKSPPVKQFVERKYTNTGLLVSAEQVLSIFNTDGTISSYELGKGEVTAPCPSGDCYVLGTLLRLQPGEPGLLEEHWFQNVGDEAGNAVPHDDVSVVFPNGVHASGQPADTVVTVGTSYIGSDSDEPATQGYSQSRYLGEIVIFEDALIYEDNGNTGERIEIKKDGVVIASVSGSDTVGTTGSGAIPNGIAIKKGIYLMETLLSDLTAFSGVALRVSYDGGETKNLLPSYKPGTSKIECIKVEKCNGLLKNAVSGEAIKVGENDEWIECADYHKQCEIQELLSAVVGSPDDECGC